jgi:hypothetical protein
VNTEVIKGEIAAKLTAIEPTRCRWPWRNSRLSLISRRWTCYARLLTRRERRIAMKAAKGLGKDDVGSSGAS